MGIADAFIPVYISNNFDSNDVATLVNAILFAPPPTTTTTTLPTTTGMKGNILITMKIIMFKFFP